MSFRMHNRKLLFKLETIEGTAAAPVEADYIECIDPTFTVTGRTFERSPTRKSITPAPLHTVGTGRAAGAPSATVEMSFQIELAGTGTAAPTVATAPRWTRILKACGLEEHVLSKATVGNIASTASTLPEVMRNFDRLSSSATSGGTYTAFGRAVSDTFYDDGTLYYYLVSGGSHPANSAYIKGAAQSSDSTAQVTAGGGGAADAGLAYMPTSTGALGGSADTSATIRLYLDNKGDYVEAVGCRGNVEFAFASGDRVLLNVTMTGALNAYVVGGGTDINPTADGTELPPGFVGVALGVAASSYESSGTSRVQYEGLVFNTMSVNMGNDTVVRESVSNTTGYDVSYITGRSMQMTFNPDAVTNALVASGGGADFWDRFLSGGLTAMDFTVGTEAGNKFLFKMPAVQFTGIADGNRDETMVWDSSCTLTGGDYGSSIQERGTTATTTTAMSDRLGRDNEFSLILL